MTSINHSNNLSLVTLPYPSSTPPPSSAGSSSSTSSTGWTKKITKKINKLKTKLESLNKLKEAKNGYLPEQDSKSLDSLPTQVASLETVHKLAEFAEQLHPSKNASNNILNNLCTGLETFLGFNSATKGYDGTGIVYSDLDRLCDGVMGFLYQVLKDVSEKQPYSVGKNTLDRNILTLFNNHLCSGCEGFKELFDVLPARIERYNSDVQQGNERVKRPINEMIKYVDKKSGKLYNGLNDLQASMVAAKPEDKDPMVYNATTLVEDCLDRASNAEKALKAAHFNIVDLNANLRDRVINALETLRHERHRLDSFFIKEKNGLKEMENTVSETMDKLRINVNREISAKIGTLVSDLRKFVTKITTQLSGISKNLRNYVADISEWIKTADGTMTAALLKVDEIIKTVGTDDSEKGKKQNVDQAAQTLRRKADELRSIAASVRDQVETWATAALKEVAMLDKAVRIGLYELKGQIETQMHTYVKEKLLGSIKSRVGQIIKSSTTGGLQKIETEVRAWALKFDGEENLGDRVNDWVRHFVSDDALVMEKISEYVNKRSNLDSKYATPGFKVINDNLATVFAQQIVLNLKVGVIDDAAQDVQQGISGNNAGTMKGYFDAVAHGCEQFASGIEVKMKDEGSGWDNPLSKGINTISTKIAEAIEQVIMQNRGSYRPDINTNYLAEAVKRIITALTITARQTATDIAWLTADSNKQVNIGNVSTALVVANELDSDLNTVTEPQLPLNPIKPEVPYKPTDKVDSRIRGILDAEVGVNNDGRDSKVGRVLGKNFHHYGTYINQDESTLNAINRNELKGNENEGKLSQSIGDIREKVRNVQHLGIVIDQQGKGAYDKFYSDTFQTLFANVKKTLDDLCTAVEKVAGKPGPHYETSLHKQLTTFRNDAIKGNNENIELQKIHNDLYDLLSGDLTKAINDAETFLTTESAKLEEDCVISLLKHVDEQVQIATSTLTTLARKQYVTSVKHLLTAFARKVTEELSPLPDLIDKDRKEGFKGFMRTLQGTITNNDTSEENIEKLSGLVADLTGPHVDTKKCFVKLADAYEDFFRPLKNYMVGEIQNVSRENNRQKNPPGAHVPPYSYRLLQIDGALTTLLQHLKERNRYDYQLHELLDNLAAALNGLKPENFSTPNTPVLDAIDTGFHKFIHELRKVYISAYDSNTFNGGLTENTRQIIDTSGAKWTSDLSEVGRKAAKILCTILPILFFAMRELRIKCNDVGKFRSVYSSTDDNENPLGDFLSSCGYRVATATSKQDGELRNSSGLASFDILVMTSSPYKLFTRPISDIDNGILNDLCTHINEYNRVCHYATATSTKHPSSVYQMLLWFSGFRHSPVYVDFIADGFIDLFEKPEKAVTNVGPADPPFEDLSSLSLPASPNAVTVGSLTETLSKVCHSSHDLLVAVLGHGHSEGRYACDFDTNPDKFAYPSDPSKCLDVLFEVSMRLQEQLYLLYTFCKGTKATMSWRECWYGRGVGGSSWKCNTMQCPEQIADQSADQIHKQTCNLNCNQTAECGLKSPLQSFLEDGLPGFMPHPHNKADCKMTCSLSNHRGIPCKTPMGFSDLSVMASHTSKGERIVEALRDFCGQSKKPLSQLCSLLLCLLNRPPQTLGDMFAFYYNFIANWGGKGREHKRDAFNGAVNDAYFGAAYEDFTINNVFGSHIHGEDNHKKGDLFGLVDCYSAKGDRTPKGSCGPYMRPISGDIRNTFASKHAGSYLSWVVYITETFYDLLKKLFEECNKCCGEDKPKCRTAKCSRNCNFNGKKPDPNHADSCDSIVNCKFTRPTLYKYGFVHEDALMLADKQTKRTCKDFCKALKTVLSDKVDDDAALAKLVYVTIPEFLFKIRAPFMTLTLALWLLSVLYLFHIMVIRLDLLHIKSHLHSPSSHRIAAQSLLAAGRVNKLNRVFYLQP